jgi:tetratricopeptide (TPR) repeat protein
MNWLTTLWEQLAQVWRDFVGGEKGKHDHPFAFFTKKKKNASSADKYDHLLKVSGQFLEQQQYELALQFANEAIDLMPEDARGYYDRAGIAYALRDYANALEDYSRAIRLQPRYAYAYNNRGLVWFFGYSDPEKALADFDTSLQFHNSEPHIVHGNRALALRMQGDLQAALAACNDALRLKPDAAEFISNRAIIHYALGDNKAALNDITAAMHENAELIYPYVNRAFVYCSQGDYPTALANLALAERRDPTLIYTWLARSTVYFLMHDFAAALEQAQHAYDLQPDRPGTWGQIALVGYALGDKAAAREWWTKFVARQPRYQRPENVAYFCDYLPALMDMMRRMQAEFGTE